MTQYAERLSPNTLAQIVDRFGARPEGRSDGSWRFPLLHCRATARPGQDHDGKEDMSIEIVDLSLRGFGFKTNACVAPDMPLTVELQIPGLPKQIWRCRVVNVQSYDGKEYRAGACFGTAD
jgi:hypothetical protein